MTVPKTILTERFARAVDYARVLHAGDVRKGTDIAYLSHLLFVSSIVLEYGGTEDQAIAGLLHDAAEDHGGHPRLASIKAEFGDEVAKMVEVCSDSLRAEGEQKAPWWERKVRYLEHLENLDESSDEVALVSAADKLHNAGAVLADYRADGEPVVEKFNQDAGRMGTLWYYRRLSEILPWVLSERAPDLGKRLSDTVAELFAEVCQQNDASVIEAEYAQAQTREAEILARIS